MKPDGYPQSETVYEVGAATPLPMLMDIQAVERVSDPVDSRLDAVYFDTATLALATRRITLRRRTGGIEHGWHLGIPDGTTHWQEINAPLGQPDAVPGELLTHVLAYTRGEGIAPIVHLGTQRSTYRLYGTGGEHLADFVDDRIQAKRPHSEGPGVEWREWKLQLVHGDNDVLVAAEETLAATGAGRSRHGSELARALGGAFPPERATGTGKPRKKGPAIDVVTAYLDVHVNALLSNDAGVRLELPDAVHQMRSTTRRLRSALSTYADLYTKDAAQGLGAELKWFARILGLPRDAEVMRDRLRQRIDDLPESLRAGPVPEPMEREIGTAYNVDYRELLKVLESDRYYRLLDDLERFRDDPPASPRASRPARSVTAKLVNGLAKRLDRAHKSVARTKAGSDRDVALHHVRKEAKRLLHVADSVAEIHGKRARKISLRAHRLQRTLGDHHDSVMVRALLEELVTDPTLPEGTVKAYRRILKIERDIARAAAKKYSKTRKKLSRLRLHR